MKADDWDRLIKVAKEYCDLIEQRDRHNLDGFLRHCLILLSRLIHESATLGVVDNDEDLPPDTTTHEQWQELFNDLQKKLGNTDEYSTVFNAYEDKKAMRGSLADDLADIYREFKDGLVAIEDGVSQERVIWQWRLMFWTHWGRHATSAIKAIHDYLRGNIAL